MDNMEQHKIINALMEHTLELIIAFDKTGNILDYNQTAEEILGYDEKITGINITEILRKSFKEEDSFPDALQSIKEQEEAFIYRKNGTCFSARIQIKYYEEADCYLLFAIDIETRKDIEHELAHYKEMAIRLSEVKNEFAANVTHELRTPLNGIRGHVENMKETYLTTEQRKTLDIIEHCCNNMSAIINNILDFSKIQSGKFELEERKFDFQDMIDHIVSTNMAAVNEKGLRLTVNIDENIPRLLIGDELRLTQIMNNFLSNAIKFTSIGFIRIEAMLTFRKNSEVELFFVVADSGIGIALEEQEDLFKSFSQVDASITRRYGGTGLGLAITKELVEMMKGKVYLESEKGRGSNFSFSVRLQTAEKEIAKEEYKKEILQFIEQQNNSKDYKEIEEYYHFGTEKNQSEIAGRMEKLILGIELGAWEKAEMWTGELGSLVENAEVDIKRAVLKLQMAIRKENYETSIKCYDNLKKLIEDTGEIAHGIGE